MNRSILIFDRDDKNRWHLRGERPEGACPACSPEVAACGRIVKNSLVLRRPRKNSYLGEPSCESCWELELLLRLADFCGVIAQMPSHDDYVKLGDMLEELDRRAS